jgi:hypothetical protein
VQLIREYRLPREAVPTQFLAAPAVWEVLLETDMPMAALIRNLATQQAVSVPDLAGSEATHANWCGSQFLEQGPVAQRPANPSACI